jgi:hypothetical protein
MLGKFVGMIRGRKEGASPSESFGAAELPRALGLDILRGTPERRNFVQGIRDSLSSMTREEKDELVDRVLARLSLFVFDLPASERNHHARRFGLLDHLLEVAFYTARELSGPGFEVSPEPSVNHREGPLWAYAGVIAAVAHDIGKPLDLEVTAPGSSEPWDPLREPLRHFCLRHRVLETGPEFWHWRGGRGMGSHERAIQALFPIVVPAEVGKFLGPRLGSILRALGPDEDWTEAGIPAPALDVVRVVRRIDRASSIADGEDDPARPRPLLAVPASEPASSPFGPSRVQELPELPGTGGATAGPSETSPEDALALAVWDEPVPKPKPHRGDPVETARRLDLYLEPGRFINLVYRMIQSHRIPRNGLYSELYVVRDYVWLVIPGALRRIARINHLPFDTDVLKRMMVSLQASPLIEPADPRTLPWLIRTRPDSSAFRAIRIKTEGFLSPAELEGLGFYDFEIRVLGPATPAGAAGWGSR